MKKQTAEQLRYQQKVKEKTPKSKWAMQCLLAFLSGGAICAVGQLVHDIGALIGLDTDGQATFTAMVMVFLGAFLTGIGVYDRIGSWAGAGSVVPITGFANSIVSPAMEFKREGMILGTCTKMFSIAGPVIVFGITSSVIYGIILVIVQSF